MNQPPAEEPEADPLVMFKIPASLRDRISKTAQRMFMFGGRCSLRAGKELPPVQSAIIDAALTVAGRHADEFATEIVRRTDERAEAAHVTSMHKMSSARPR